MVDSDLRERTVARRPPPPLSRSAAWAAGVASCLYLGVFAMLGRELLHDGGKDARFVSMDQTAALWAVDARRGWLTRTALEVTSLGSPSVLGIVVIVAAVGLYLTRDRHGALLLASATGGAIGWTAVLKNLIERERPPIAARLVVTSGYSFPSGHSLASATILGALALIACRHLPSRSERGLTLGVAAAVMLAVALSRVYLGVHYFTDVVAGTSFGLAWTLSWAAALTALEHRRIGTRV